MQVGTTKDQSLCNKPSAAVHPGALAGGTLPQYNTISVADVLSDVVIQTGSVLSAQPIIDSAGIRGLKCHIIFYLQRYYQYTEINNYRRNDLCLSG